MIGPAWMWMNVKMKMEAVNIFASMNLEQDPVAVNQVQVIVFTCFTLATA